MTRIEAIHAVCFEAKRMTLTENGFRKFHRALKVLGLNEQEIRQLESDYEYRRTPDSPVFVRKNGELIELPEVRF